MIPLTLVRLAFHDSDWRWVQSRCLEYSGHPDADVRGAAVTCLGHIARIHRQLDLDEVLPVLERLHRDPDLFGHAEDSLNDIEHFMPAEIAAYRSRHR